MKLWENVTIEDGFRSALAHGDIPSTWQYRQGAVVTYAKERQINSVQDLLEAISNKPILSIDADPPFMKGMPHEIRHCFHAIAHRYRRVFLTRFTGYSIPTYAAMFRLS